MVKNEDINDTTCIPPNTEEQFDIDLPEALDKLTIRVDWYYEASRKSNNAVSLSHDSTSIGTDIEDSILDDRTSFKVENQTLTNNIFRLDSRGDGEVTRLGAGESYRPNHNRRSPPRADTFRSDRDRDRSPRRDRRTPPLSSDSYHPGGRDRSPRRRSRTPPYRARDRSPPRDMTWRGRPRSPLRGGRTPLRARSPRRFSPRRDDDRRERPRSPRRDDRYIFAYLFLFTLLEFEVQI